MKLGVVKYEQKGEMPKKNGIARYLPSKLVEVYIEHIHPYDVKETELLGVEAYEIQWKLTNEQIRNKGDYGKRMMDKMLQDVSQRGVKILVPPLQGGVPLGILPLADGKAMKGFFVMDAIQKVLKAQQKELKDCRIVLIDGGNFLTQLVLDRVYPHVNFLSILTDRQEDYDEKIQDIYEECGLNVFLFSRGKNAAMSEADVVLNCGCEMENFDYTMKQQVFYFDLAQNRRKMERLCVRRKDIFLVDGILIRKEKEHFTDREVEGAWYASKDSFQHFLDSRYHGEHVPEIQQQLQDDGLLFFGFTCMGKRVRP